jgi:uncharacterized protein (DUF58 family)
MVPARRLVLLSALLLTLAVAALADARLHAPLYALDALVALMALVDALLGRGLVVSAERRVPGTLSIGRPNVIEVELRSSSRRHLVVQLVDDAWSTARTDLPLTATLKPRGGVLVRYRLIPQERGAFVLGDHHLRWPTPLGLWLRQRRIAAQHPVRVYPDLQAVRAYELLARQDREHALLRTARLRGGESEFERLREYQKDDEFRNIDWKATARRQTLIARDYQLERNQNLIFALDSGRLMTAQSDGAPGQKGLSHFDCALNATLMLSHVALRLSDHVGQLCFDSEVRSFVPPATGRRASQQVVRASYDVMPRLVETDFRVALDQLARRARKRSLVVLFTQVIDDPGARDLVTLARSLLPRHLPLVVLFRDVALYQLADAHPSAEAPLDLCIRGAAAELLAWRERLLSELKRAGVLTLDVAPAQLTPALINSYLEIKARQLL